MDANFSTGLELLFVTAAVRGDACIVGYITVTTARRGRARPTF
jgi:hypothetical protein